MTARHRLAELPRQQRLPSDRPTRSGLVRKACTVVAVSMIVAAGLAALLVTRFGAEREAGNAGAVSTSGAQSPHDAQHVSQEGTVIAVTADSVTARSSDGYTQTYLLTPNTTVLTRAGDHSHSAIPHFAINDEVAIVGTIQNGTVLATALTHRQMAHGDGPPMDYVLSPQ